jgi:FkbH-like protein
VQFREALRIVQENSCRDLPPFRVLLACGFNPLHLQTFLSAHCQLRLPSRNVLLSTGLYGDLWGTLSRIERPPLDACAIVLEWPDLDPRLGFRQLGGWGPKDLTDIVASVQSRLSGLRETLLRTPGHLPVALSCPTLPLPPVFHIPACQVSEAELRVHQAVDDFALWATGRPHFTVVNRQSLLRISPFTDRLDFKAELFTGMSYTATHADRLGSLLAQLLVPLPPKKGLITDLDGTLWSGIVGEVGAQALRWDLASHAQVHGLYQQLLRALADQGVLIGVASKNDPDVVEEAFQRNDLLLPRQRVFPMESHWKPKSESVARILHAWNVGAESVVFVDDSPMELAEVKAAFPGMHCVLFVANDYAGVESMMYSLRDLFAKERITHEDLVRQESLRAAEGFQSEVRKATHSYEDFMRGAKAEVTLDFVSGAMNPRSLDLINKTNQFNLNGVRYTQSDWHNSLKLPNSFALTTAYLDKYGPLGIIAVLKGHVDQKTVLVDTWVMSCRAFARRIEYQCLRILFEHFAAEEIFFNFAPTPRNECLQDFFAGFLGEKPVLPFRISHSLFQEKCPELYQKIEVKA